MSDHPHDNNQPDIDHIDAFNHRVVIFEDGLCGKITQWIDSSGNVHDEPVHNTVAIVAKHPGQYPSPWYSCALGQDELYREKDKDDGPDFR
jgi:hypothetical protein